MHLCTSLCTCPTPASTHFTVYFPCTCYVFHRLLSLPCIFIPAHASTRFTLHLPYECLVACLYAFHCLLSMRMPLCTSLCACPAHASLRFTADSAHASMQFTVQFPAHHLCISLCTGPMQSSRHFIVYFPYACLAAFHCLPSLRMPLCISLRALPTHASTHYSCT